MSPAEANWRIYRLLKDGVNVTITDPDDDVETDETLKVIDWDNPENNDFFLASQFRIAGEMYRKKPGRNRLYQRLTTGVDGVQTDGRGPLHRL